MTAGRCYGTAMLERWSGGFDWDEGNRAKCAKHGVSPAEIEAAFASEPLVVPDPAHSAEEQRFVAVGLDQRPRSVFVVVTLGDGERGDLVRPISARVHAP